MHREPQLLWNLVQRRKHWWKSFRWALAQHLPVMMITSAIGTWGAGWLVDNVLAMGEVKPGVPSGILWFCNLSAIERFVSLLPICGLFALPLVLACIGHFPRQKDVESDQMLHRAMGLSDQVSDATNI